MKDFFRNLPSSGWAGAIGLIIFLIILNGILMEWTAVKFPTEYHQTGWEFVGMIMMMVFIIPSSLLASLLITGLISLWRKQKPKDKLFFWTAVVTAFVLLLGLLGPIWIKNIERIIEVYVLPENLEEQRGCVIRGSHTIEEKDGLHYVSYSSACRQAIGELFTGVHLPKTTNDAGLRMFMEKHTYEAGVLLKNERSSFCGDVISEGLFESKCEDYHVKGIIRNNKLEDIWSRFNKNGSIKERIIYKNGLRHGVHETFYATGELNWVRNYKDGKLHGLWESFFKDGKTYILSNWNNGIELNQTRFAYFDDGQLKVRQDFKGNKPEGLYEEFDEEGLLIYKGTYEDRKMEGLFETYD